MLHTSQLGPYVFPVPSEYSNWRDETEAWANTAILLDQSHHMTDLYIEGPDTIRLLSDLAINNFKNFGRNKAKQLVACNYDGHVIGDAVLFGLEDTKVNIVGRPHVPNWVQFHAETGGYDVQIDRDERTLANSKARKTYRFEIQGPNAWQVLERLNGGAIPEMKFFGMGEITIAGQKVRALKHGMAAAPGLEIWGPSENSEEVRGAIVEAGRDFGLLQGGARAYSTASTESGWLASVLPAVYSGDKMQSYREWLPSNSFEATASLGGSYYTDNIEDYYINPWDAGYSFIHFDHDFIGRDSLLEKRNEPHLKKVTLTWDIEDVVRIFRSQFNEGDRFKFMEMPASYYATFPFDQVLLNGKRVGLSTYPVYSTNARRWISLAMVDADVSESGTSVSVLWGEPDGGSARPVVERHVQTEIKAIVGPSPMPSTVRENYRPYTSLAMSGLAA
jgi:glycine cleavage system aminomethyltransferase T